MTMVQRKNISPLNKGKTVNIAYEDHPMASLHKAVNRLFDDFYMSFELIPFTEFEDLCVFLPRIDMSDNGQTLTITAELPGMERDAIEVCVEPNCVTIQGNKENESDVTGTSNYCMERIFGNFKRAIPLPHGMDTAHTRASYKNGILTVTIPRRKGYKAAHRIKINNGV